MAEFEAAEEFILTVCANGYGKRTSAYEYRRTNRGGQGITNIDNLERNGPVVASFPAHNGEQLMLVTDQAKLIRMSVGDTRVIGRNSAGVRLFHVAEDEHVVSAARIEESEEEDGRRPRPEPKARPDRRKARMSQAPEPNRPQRLVDGPRLLAGIVVAALAAGPVFFIVGTLASAFVVSPGGGGVPLGRKRPICRSSC